MVEPSGDLLDSSRLVLESCFTSGVERNKVNYSKIFVRISDPISRSSELIFTEDTLTLRTHW